MENIVRERIKTILKENGETPNSLSNGNSAIQRKLQRQINEGAAITVDTLLMMLEKFPDASTEWLLRGKGDMLIQEQNSPMLESEKYDAEVEIENGVITIRRK